MSEPAPLNVALVKPWQDIGIINQLPPRKGEIQATRNASSTNLVLVYLESFNLALLSHPDWPGLAPGVANLQDEHGWEHPVYSSATVTVEGIANSQCGTLVPFFQGNDSLASGSGLGEELPCMADVLRSAGYYQVYMGGAKVGFAGKGEFLRAHGFDEVLGWEHWKRRGLERNGAWGLSDIQLFDQATRKLEELQERELPFNLTLLTIGTHIPGQSYQECQPYGDGQERFLNAVHCTDQLLSRWVKEITEKGLLENTTLIVTADHGVFDNFAMRQVFGEMTKDTRLPFIIIGDSEPGSVTQAPGASVDLPATILDLLEIDTNANFLVGNSLLRGTQTPEYFLSRYMDIDAYGNIHHNNAATCEHDGPVTRPSLPLDSCEKRSLLHALKASMDSFSQKRQQVFCQSEEPLSAWVNDEKHQVSIKVSGLDQVPKFSREGAAVDVGKPGIWALGIEPTGHILSRRFYLASEAEMLVESIQSQPETIWLLVVDLSDNPPPLTSALKNIQLNSKRKAIALVASDGRVIEHASALLNDGLNFSIGKDNCLMVFSNQ